MTNKCANCSIREADPYVFRSREESTEEAYLCDECFSTIEQEFVWPN